LRGIDSTILLAIVLEHGMGYNRPGRNAACPAICLPHLAAWRQTPPSQGGMLHRIKPFYT